MRDAEREWKLRQPLNRLRGNPGNGRDRRLDPHQIAPLSARLVRVSLCRSHGDLQARLAACNPTSSITREGVGIMLIQRITDRASRTRTGDLRGCDNAASSSPAMGAERSYRLDMARNAKADKGHAIARLPDSGEDTIRNLVALPLRDARRDAGHLRGKCSVRPPTHSGEDPLDERVVELEMRVDSLEEQATGRRGSARSRGAAKQKTPTAGTVAEPERSGSSSPAPGSGHRRGAECQPAGSARNL